MSILLATEQKAQDRIWEHFQNEGAESFQQSSGRLRFLVNLIPRGSRVLDVGVGAGVFESLALQRGLDVFCLDPSERSIRALQSKLGLGEQAQVGYSQDMPFANESFDYVVMSEVLEHLSDQVVTDTVTEVHRVLVPGGRMLGTVPSRESLDEQQVLCPCCGDRFHRWGHLQSFSPARIRDMFSQGFVVEQVQERPFESFAHLNWKGKSFAVLRLLQSRLGVRSKQDRIWFVARKAGEWNGPAERSLECDSH